jgi:hypothetical protein
MQNLRVITGKRQEGKTTELLENYFLRYSTTYTVELDNGESILRYFRDTNRLIYISSQTVNVFKENMLDICNTEDYKDVYLDIINGKHITYHGVDNWFKLIKIIKEEIKENDCIFFIDDCEKHNKLKEFLELILCYPNQDCKNSFDIVMTYGK